MLLEYVHDEAEKGAFVIFSHGVSLMTGAVFTDAKHLHGKYQ